ncbi:MAG: Tn3 family transposase [Inquilinus sp.]|uniref:Tn3 family transposase n=1 Tax=Inquilinus sp. TaxID=1932117 RepID=UPI003F3A0C76
MDHPAKNLFVNRRRVVGRDPSKSREFRRLAFQSRPSRPVCFHRLGRLRDRTLEDQKHRASGLYLVVASNILWNTDYIERAISHEAWRTFRGVLAAGARAFPSASQSRRP